MEPTVVVRENWLTRKPKSYAIYITYAMALLLTSAGHFSPWLSATPEQVFQHKEYWRAWSALLAHADIGHLLSNSMILLPLAHFLSGYYGWLFFPVLGLFMGGITNLLVLKTMAPTTALLGISGVVNWMGAAWLTLFVLIDRRESPRRRVAVAVMLTMMLFVPDTFRPEISYLSHFIGFILGTLSALAYYVVHRSEITAAEVKEFIYDSEPDQQSVLPPIS